MLQRALLAHVNAPGPRTGFARWLLACSLGELALSAVAGLAMGATIAIATGVALRDMPPRGGRHA